jgi:glycosyltransferase involved in cell wall biosynthesis
MLFWYSTGLGMELVSIIIPTFNRSTFLLRAIKSVLNQSYKNFELIVVDDGSTDDTEILLQDLITNKSIHYYKKSNGGVASARNFGAIKALGHWYAFLDSDDEWLPNKLQDQLSFLLNNSHLNIVYGEEIWMRNGVRVNQKKHHKKSGGHIFEKCLEQCLIAPSSVLLTKKLFEEKKGFDESFIICEDYDLWLKISSSHEIGFIEQPLIVKYGGHEDQLSTKYFAMDMWR